MLVGKFFNNINRKNRNHYFSGLSFNSKNIKKNNIFFAIEGSKANGKKYIKEAIKNGATTIISNLNFLGKKEGQYFCSCFSNIKTKICVDSVIRRT